MKRVPCLLLLLPLLVFTGCVRPKPTLPPPPAAEVLLQRLAESARHWQQIDTAAEVGIHLNGKYISTRQFLLAEKPQRLRIDVLSLFGQLALQLTVFDEQLQVFLNTTVPGQYYQGPLSDELLARLTHLPLRAAELVRLLLYDPPRPGFDSARVESVDGRYRLSLAAVAREEQFFFDGDLRLREGLYLRDGQVQLRVLYDRFDEADQFPRRVEIELPQQRTRVTLGLSEVRLNQPVGSERFRLKLPPGAVPLELPEMAPEEGHS